MRRMHNNFLLPALCAGMSLGLTVAAIGKKKQETAGVSEHQRAVHVLNRFAFGPRPGDVDHVTAMGADKWFEQQLHPDQIDDSGLEARLMPLRTLRMETREMVENFPPQKVLKAIAEGREPLPRDPAKRAVYEAQLARYEEKQDRKQAAATNPPSDATAQTTANNTASDDEKARRREAKLYADLKAEELLDLPPDQRMKKNLKMPPDEQRALIGGNSSQKNEILQSMVPQQSETAMALNNPQQVVTSELMQGKLLRDTYSERQLEAVMADFWFNHFNVFVGKGADRYMLTSYERDVIRPHALGKFEDLLVATAKSPAMLFYLDNWLSVGPGADAALGIRRQGGNRGHGRPNRYPRNWPPRQPNANLKGKNRNGLNENYGRELMELHTLGVNGGYTQRDVTEVARVFTGWTLHEPRQGGDFSFEERLHEPGEKTVLGKKIKEHGEKEGLEVLHLLAHQPSTAKFVCSKLAMRFVSDNPPPALVNRMADTFLKKDGDIREVLRTMYQSPEFWVPEAYRAKVKTPLEFVISALRATSADVQNPAPALGALQNMGMPLYGMQPPTGYSMKAETWVNSSALLGRMNFALALANGKLKGTPTAPSIVLGEGITNDTQSPNSPTDAHRALAAFENAYLDGTVSPQTHDAILKQLDDPQITGRKLDDNRRPPNLGAIAGLILGSPEFQKR